MHKIVLFFLLASVSARGATFTWAAESYLFGVRSEPATSYIPIPIPNWTLGVDLRPQAEWRPTERWRFITRPRLRLREDWFAASQKGNATFQLDDLNVSFSPSDSVNLTAGIENYQWGPAELASPSNPLFHFQLDQRSLIFRQRGLGLARASWSIDPNLIVTGIVEIFDYRPFTWLAGEAFSPRTLVKIEKRFANAANYVGLTGGRMEARTAFLGAYGNVYLDDSFSLYGDARVSFQSPALIPQVQSGGSVAFVRDNRDRACVFGTAGVRYEGAVDVRLEYLYNGFGYTESQWGLALLSGILIQPGLELPKRHYLYLSLRTDRLGKGDKLRVAARALLSLQDGSGYFALPVIEWAFTDNFTALLQPSAFFGTTTAELMQGARYELLAGVRASL